MDDLIVMVNIVLGNTLLSACPSADTNGTSTVSIVQLILGVRNLLHGCPNATPSTPEAL